MAMTNKQLLEILNQYPDESIICIFEGNNFGGGSINISEVNINYDASDDYNVPQITLK